MRTSHSIHYYFLIIGLLLHTSPFYGQEVITVTGIITSTEDNLPLPGASVVVKGTTHGTVTDFDGNYNLTVNTNDILLISFLGYNKQEIQVDGRREINISLSPDNEQLSEVVVIGYGTVKKSDLTGSVSSVAAEELNSFPTTNVLQALEGRAAGVQVLQSSGAPGAGMSLRIRGQNSIQGGNDPLFVIDGFPFSGNPTFLSNSDIESIEILKDASATAIYGSRGANGVVIITTKRGKIGKTRIELEASYGVQTLREKLDLMNGSEFAEFNNIQAINDGLDPYFTPEEVAGFGEGTDWQDVVFRDAPIQTLSANVGGGNEKTQFSIGGAYFDQDGIIEGSEYSRYSLQSSIDHEINDLFSVSLSNTLSYVSRSGRDNGGGSRGNSMIGAALAAAPISNPYNEDGSYTDLGNAYSFIAPDMINPLNWIKEQPNETKANTVLANAALIFKPWEELTFRFSGGVENRDDRTDAYTTTNFLNSTGRASVSTGQFRSLLSENTVNYNHLFNEKHQVSAVAGFTYQDFENTFLSASGTGFLSNIPGTHDLGSAAIPGIPSTGYSKSVLLSYLGRVNYSYNNKYFVTASFRSDGSSRFSENNKWGYFPSAALAWKLSEEDFLKDSEVISDLKLRASWGITGSQAINPYTTLNLLNSGMTVFETTLYPYFQSSLNLPGDLKWETTDQKDIGIDLAFFNNRIFLTADYYIKETEDLLNVVSLPHSMGWRSTVQNIGEVQNRGFEFGLDAHILNGEFKWELAPNISFNKNKVVSLYGGEDIFTDFRNVVVLQDNLSIYREGRPIGQFYGYIEDGYTDEGKIKYRDLNSDGVINGDDKTYIGDPNPNFTYGINSTMSYKNFELTLFIQGSYGNDIFNLSSVISTMDYGMGVNMPREVLYNHWTPENTDAKYPVISRSTSTQVSDRWVEDGSYMRLKNIKLAYNLNAGIERLENLQIYASGQNLVTITDYSWWDPAVGGVDHYSYPFSQTINFGVRAEF